MRWMLLVGLLLGCARNDAAAEPPVVEPDVPVRVEAPEQPAAPETEMTPEALYAECRDRVEEPQAPGECETDADCTRAGCSQEICTTVEAAADLVSTCEVRPCFAVLDTCTCQDGMCTWTLKDEVPPLGRPLPLPEPPSE